ncbi:DHA2 family efflux MFS transporter permease subunit [Kitasatospora sp. NPDC056138]|uniref:DHA2 family efflux MFS transporter permease subunit n=1 Tax=Kitasatospora sp. NPDC056138 TaxID=3345724 RepID=UPI0035D8A0C3
MSTSATPRTRIDPPPTAGAALRPTALVVVLGAFMSVLDTTAVNTAMHDLGRSFDAPLTTIQWVATGYTLALATVIPITAWAVGRLGAKRLYLTALTLFGAGSALAGLAWNTETLIVFRVLQGLGGGMLTPVGMTLVLRAAGPERTGRAMSVLGLPVLIGPLAGPILGGALLDAASWRWIFFINPPVAAVAILLAARILPRETPRPGRRLDLLGLLLLSPGLAVLIYGLTSGGAALPMLIGATMVLGFIARALTTTHPLLDLRLLARRPFAAAAGAQLLFVCAYFGSLILLPLYYQGLRGQNAAHSGLLGIPQAVATGVTMQFAGRLIDRHPPGRIVLTGVTVATTGFLCFSVQVTGDVPFWHLQAALTVMGVGVGLTMMPTIAAATRSVAPEEVPLATTAVTILQQVAASTGTALMSVLLTDALRTAPHPADAFRHTYGWAVGLMALALLPALLLPRRRTA